jgi:ParB-like chromosome segregation protein Spo0J
MEQEKSQISRREGRTLLINQYEEVLQEKQRIISQFQCDQDQVMKKLDCLKQ